MPSIAQIPVSSSIMSSPPSGKKRKRDHTSCREGEDQKKLSSMQYTSPLPPFRESHDISPPETTLSTAAHPSHGPRPMLKPRSVKPLRPHDAKRQRISLSEPGRQHQEDLTTAIEYEHEHEHERELFAPVIINANVHPTSLRGSVARDEGYTRTDLRPCHICHQKPKVRTDLDSYDDCEGCRERTCNICMRECLGPASPVAGDGEVQMGSDGLPFTKGDERRCLKGWPEDRRSDAGATDGHGEDDGSGWLGKEEREWRHWGMICSQCCVELGVDGEVRCLGCLRAENGG